MRAPPLSVVIPAFNEAARIGPGLESARVWLGANHPGSEIVVVDDGSADGTCAVVEGLVPTFHDPALRCLRLPQNRGKGAAVREGMLAADRPYVLFTDADFSTPLEEVEKLLSALGSGAEVAIGSRSVGGARVEVRQPLYRVLMGKTFNKVIRVTTVGGFIDTQCGFKLFPREVARRLFSAAQVDGFAFDVEILWLARRAGLRVAEVAVRWRNDPASTVHPVWDSLRMLRDIGRIRWIHRATRV